ncbi:TPA: his operon leader peptide, partial [Escherichia coli]|nr:his operon leader peptide [Escherichia coli]
MTRVQFKHHHHHY